MTTATRQANPNQLTDPPVTGRRRTAAADPPVVARLAQAGHQQARTSPAPLNAVALDPIVHAATVHAVPDGKPSPTGHRPPAPGARTSPAGTLLRLPTALAHSGFAAARLTADLVTLPRRVLELMGTAEQILSSARLAVSRTHALLDRVEAVTRTAEGVAHHTDEAVTTAAGTAAQAGALMTRATALLDTYAEPLRNLESLLARLTRTTHAGGVDAVVTLLDRLPLLAEAMEREVIPLLEHLDEVGPDVNQLLDGLARINNLRNRVPQVFRRRHPQGA